MPQLDPTWYASQIFWLGVAFVLLYVIVSRYVLPPLQDVLLRRQNAVDHDLNQAQVLKSQADQARLDYERTLAEARERAQNLMTQTMDAYKTKAETANKEIDRQIEVKLSEATRRINAKKDEMMKELTPTISELTAMIFEKLTKQRPNPDSVSRVLSELKGRR